MPLAIKNTYVGDQAVIAADAKLSGNGGEVIVWADNYTRFDGTITARGFNGGFVETSGKNILHVGDSARVNVGANGGQAGTWLLDPLNIQIGAVADANVTTVSPFTPTASPSRLSNVTLNNALSTGNVVIQTTGTVGNEPGDVTFLGNASVTWSTGSNLTVNAYRSIVVQENAVINATGAGSITFNSSLGNGNPPAGNYIGIHIQGQIFSNTGDITLNGRGGNGTLNNNYGVFINGHRPSAITPTNAIIQSNSGNITINGIGGDSSSGGNHYGVYINGGARIQNTSGNITITGIAPSNGANSDGVFITTNPRGNDSGSNSSLENTTFGQQTTITNVNGNIQITGVANGTGATNDGIAHWNALVQTTGSGNITYHGTSGTGTAPSKDGLEFQRYGLGSQSAEIKATGSGNIFLTGVLRGGNATDNAIKFGEDPPRTEYIVMHLLLSLTLAISASVQS
ncbi:MAG: hypothetical protein ACK4HM_03290 [Thermosynechococcus sp.]